MDFKPPTWELVGERCACCDGQGELVFATCPKCGFVVFICTEIGTVVEIQGKRRGPKIGWLHDLIPPVCAKCQSVQYDDFRDTTAEEIIALGFQPGEFK